MAARKSAGSGAAKMKALKDKEMAAYMKRKGISRTTMRDPMTHRLISINKLYSVLGK